MMTFTLHSILSHVKNVTLTFLISDFHSLICICSASCCFIFLTNDIYCEIFFLNRMFHNISFLRTSIFIVFTHLHLIYSNSFLTNYSYFSYCFVSVCMFMYMGMYVCVLVCALAHEHIYVSKRETLITLHSMASWQVPTEVYNCNERRWHLSEATPIAAVRLVLLRAGERDQNTTQILSDLVHFSWLFPSCFVSFLIFYK